MTVTTSTNVTSDGVTVVSVFSKDLLRRRLGRRTGSEPSLFTTHWSYLLRWTKPMLLPSESRFTPSDKENRMAPRKIRRIATEEAFSIPEIAEEMRNVALGPSDSLDMNLLRWLYIPEAGTLAAKRRERLVDIEDQRLREMDENGVAMHLLLLSAPGVQMFDADTATTLAALSNDRLAEVISRHPNRFAGLAALAPQSPTRAAKEMDRAINKLKLNGFVINSHTYNEYLDDPKFFPIFEAAEALDRSIYIHPRAPSDGFAMPFRHYGMDTAPWGFGIEVATHAVRLIFSGLFDRFPKLKICLGHMGEAVHFWLWRMDCSNAKAQSGDYPGKAPKTKLKPSEYFKTNFVITTSGVEDWEPLAFSLKVLGPDNVLWAIDYPFEPTARAVAWMDSVPVSDDVREKLYHRNAERVFGINQSQY